MKIEYELTDESFVIEGRGVAHIVKLLQDYKYDDLKNVLGTTLLNKKVIGVEAFDNDNHPKGTYMVLLI